jgi:hypothetical protein
MAPRKRKAAAKTILILYAFVTVTFPLAHNDFVPLDVKLVLSPIDFHSHSVDSNASDLACPAHNFAQSTTSTPVTNQIFPAQITVFFLQFDGQAKCFIGPNRSYSTRAPPQA